MTSVVTCNTFDYMIKKEGPIAWRANANDLVNLAFLRDRLGLGNAGVIRLAIKRLFDAEQRKDS